MLQTVKLTMIHVEPVIIRCRERTRGIAGPLRVDLDRRYNFCDPHRAVFSVSGEEAFSRSLAHHARTGGERHRILLD